MKYYKDKNGNIYSVSPIQQPKPDWIKLTQEEVEAHLNPPPAPPAVPKQVSRAQGKAALITAGLWPDVLAYVDAMTDPTEKAWAEVALHDTQHWRRDSPFYNEVADHLGLSEEQKDELIIKASKIYL